VNFGERGTPFKEAERRYTELERQHEAGSISDEEFDGQLKELMVQDQEGRWWAKSRKTGQWHSYDGASWVPGTPPGQRPSPTPARTTNRNVLGKVLAAIAWIVGFAIAFAACQALL